MLTLRNKEEAKARISCCASSPLGYTHGVADKSETALANRIVDTRALNAGESNHSRPRSSGVNRRSVSVIVWLVKLRVQSHSRLNYNFSSRKCGQGQQEATE